MPVRRPSLLSVEIGGFVALGLIAAMVQARQVGVLAAAAYAIPGCVLLVAAVVLKRQLELPGIARLVAVAGGLWLILIFGLQDQHRGLRAFGLAFGSLPSAVLFHVMLALPTGRLHHRWERAVVAALYVFSGPILAVAALSRRAAPACMNCAPPPLHLNTGLSNGLAAVGAFGGIVASAVAGGLLVSRWRRAGGAGRRLLRPVLAAGAIVAIVYVANSLHETDGHVPNFRFEPGAEATDALALLAIAAVSALALTFPFGVWRASRAAGAFGRLAPRLGEEPSAEELDALLRSALGDPSVSVDVNPPAVPEPPPPHRALTDVTFGGTLLARLEHANPLLTDRESFETVIGTLGVLLGHRRLNAELAGEHDPLAVSLGSESGSPREHALAEELRALREAFTSFVGADLSERGTVPGDFDGPAVEVTVMFLDVRNFTGYAETRSPREVVALLNSFWELVVPIVVAHGGHANRYIGDGLLAVFGAPEPSDDHPDQAVLAAGAIARGVAQKYGGMLQIGVGLNTGPVAMGVVGGGGRYEFTVIGDVVNIASRVESATRETGDVVLLTEATRQRLRRRHALVSRGPVSLKGRSAPVDVYAFLG